MACPPFDENLSREDRAVLADAIHRDAQWLVRVTENLLSVTRFSGGDVSLKLTDEVLEEIVGSAIVKYRRSSDALPVEAAMPEEILVVPMDATLIEQVLINLFDNVSAHSGTATRIWLTAGREGQLVRVTVDDDGQGISPALRPGLFDGSARRMAHSRVDDRRNMGIGLSVCRSIVRAHGGELTVGDSVHGGARFTFTLLCGAGDATIQQETSHGY